jgi:hypothetical protein
MVGNVERKGIIWWISKLAVLVCSRAFMALQLNLYSPNNWFWPQWRGPAAAHLLRLRFRIPPGHECLSLVSFVCCQVEVSASGWTLFESSPTECGVTSECHCVAPFAMAMARNRAEKPQERIYIYIWKEYIYIYTHTRYKGRKARMNKLMAWHHRYTYNKKIWATFIRRSGSPAICFVSLAFIAVGKPWQALFRLHAWRLWQRSCRTWRRTDCHEVNSLQNTL